MRPIRATAALVCAALCPVGLASPSVAAADTSLRAPVGELAAHAGVLAWNPQPWGTGPLMTGFGPAAAPLPVSSARLSSLDVGTDARGRPVLVYSACRTARIPCQDLYLYSFARRSNRRLSSLSRPDCGEGGPQISRGVILFGRFRCAFPKRRERRLGAGLYLKRPGKRIRRVRLPRVRRPAAAPLAPPSFDLAGRLLAFNRVRLLEYIDDSTQRVASEIHLLRLGRRRSRLVARAQGIVSPADIGTFLSHPLLDDGFVYWQRDVFEPSVIHQQDILRRPVDGSEPAAVLERAGRLYAQPQDDPLGTGDTLSTYAVSGRHLYYSFTDPPPGSPPPNLSPGFPNAIAEVAGIPVFR